MVLISYPPYLTNQSLPLRQPAIAKCVNEIFDNEKISRLISEYACPSNQVETQGMIDFFQQRIPLERIEMMKKALPEVSLCLEDIPLKETRIFMGSCPLKNSAERKLVALASVFFGYRNRLFMNSLSLSEQLCVEKDNPEYYDFLGRIPGITILERCDGNFDSRLCHTFIFGHHDWYKSIKPNDTLLTNPKIVLDFLTSKGYTKSCKPSVGQVVVYHTPTTTNHFAKIVGIEPEGGILVVSKFGRFHIYEHRIGLAQFHYGNSVTFLNEPK